MEKRERIQLALAGETVDRPPVALWRHWPGDDQLAASFARAVVDYQRRYDWDFIKVTPFSAFMVADHGVNVTRGNTLLGDCQIYKQPVTRSLNWTELRVLDPERGELAKHLAALQMIREQLPDVPLLTTLPSPFTQARMLAAEQLALRNLRTHPGRLRTGLTVLTDTTLLMIEALRRVGIDGIFYAIDAADFTLMQVQEYAEFGLQYDRQILDALPEAWWFNALEMQSAVPMAEFLNSYPLPAIAWNVGHTYPNADKIRDLMKGAVLTGLDPTAHISLGTPGMIRNTAREFINRVGPKRLMLTAGAPVPVNAPLANLRAVRNAVEVADVV